MRIKKLIYKKPNINNLIINTIINCVFVLIIIFLITIIIFSLKFAYYDVKGTSMEPNIKQATSTYAGQGCFVDSSKDYNYGDIVVADSNSGRKIVKRVIAMEGDKIGYYKNAENYYDLVLIKKNQDTPTIIDEKYLYENVPEDKINNAKEKNEKSYNNFVYYLASQLIEIKFDGQNVKFLTVGEGKIFLLGDNRETSIDSATNGPINMSSINGKVVLVVERNDLFLWQILSHCFFK